MIRELYTRLCSEDVESWLDEEEILPSQDWDLQIRKAIRSCDIVLICLSQDAVSKPAIFKRRSSKYWI